MVLWDRSGVALHIFRLLSPLITLPPVFLRYPFTEASSSRHLATETPSLVHFNLFIQTIMVHKVSICLPPCCNTYGFVCI